MRNQRLEVTVEMVALLQRNIEIRAAGDQSLRRPHQLDVKPLLRVGPA